MNTDTEIERKHWLRSNRRSLPYILAMPVLMTLMYTMELFQGRPLSHVFGLGVIFGILEFIWIPLVTWNLIYLGERIGDKTTLRFWQRLCLKLVFCLIGVLAATWMAEHFEALFGVVDDDDYLSFGTVQLSPSATNYVTNAFIALFIAVPLFLIQERQKQLERNLKARQMEVQKLERLQVQARLEALQSKLNPHFLYNALNTLAGLVYSDPARAEQVILGLSQLFRYSLQKEDRPLVSLAEEVEIVKTYLDIEQLRFEGMLECNLEVEESLLPRMVPRFLLQPLVENAVKHGTSQIAQGRINVRIYSQAGQLKINIEDNGKPFPDPIELGFGMGSTIEKLQLLYPDKHEFGWTNSPQKSIHILIKENAHAPA